MVADAGRRRGWRILCLPLCLSHILATAAADSGTLCLLPLGDSITQAYKGYKSWRYQLWKRLVDAEVEALFVGSMVNPQGQWTQDHYDPYRGRTFPPNHEGHWGWRADEILDRQGEHGYSGSGNLRDWMETYACAPTCVLIHLGTNDACQGQSDASTIAEVEEIIELVAGRFPPASFETMTFLVAAPIPSSQCPSSRCAAVGDSLSPAILAHSWSANVSANVRVETVDMLSGFDSSFLYDCLHPNDAGEAFMAERWFGSMAQHCSRAGNATSAATTASAAASATTAPASAAASTTTAPAVAVASGAQRACGLATLCLAAALRAGK